MNYSECVKQLTEYIALQRLSGNIIALKAIYMYFVMGVSPSTIADTLGVTKNVVRGYIMRVYEKSYPMPKPYLGKILTKLYKATAHIHPIVDGGGVCMVCGVHINGYTVYHILRRHRRVVEKYVREVLGAGATGSRHSR